MFAHPHEKHEDIHTYPDSAIFIVLKMQNFSKSELYTS